MDGEKIEIITRKDGIVYERRKREKNCDCAITLKFNSKKREMLKELAEKKHINYQALIKNVLYDYIEENYYA